MLNKKLPMTPKKRRHISSWYCNPSMPSPAYSIKLNFDEDEYENNNSITCSTVTHENLLGEKIKFRSIWKHTPPHNKS